MKIYCNGVSKWICCSWINYMSEREFSIHFLKGYIPVKCHRQQCKRVWYGCIVYLSGRGEGTVFFPFPLWILPVFLVASEMRGGGMRPFLFIKVYIWCVFRKINRYGYLDWVKQEGPLPRLTNRADRVSLATAEFEKYESQSEGHQLEPKNVKKAGGKKRRFCACLTSYFRFNCRKYKKY